MIEYDYTLALALEDFVTIIFFGIGLYFLGRMSINIESKPGRLVFAGGVIITIGGISQAMWKMAIVLLRQDISLLNDAQFILMMPGYIILAAGLLQALRCYRQNEGLKNLAAISAVTILLTYGLAAFFALTSDGRTWFFVLLGMTTIVNVIISWTLVKFSWLEGEKLAGWLFLINILLVFTLAGMAGVLGQDLTGQWIKQITGNFSFAAFAVAAYLITRRVLSNLSGAAAG